MVLTCLPLIFATAVPEMFVFAALAGLCVAPQITVRNNLAATSVARGHGHRGLHLAGARLDDRGERRRRRGRPAGRGAGLARRARSSPRSCPAPRPLVLFLRRDLLS